MKINKQCNHFKKVWSSGTFRCHDMAGKPKHVAHTPSIERYICSDSVLALESFENLEVLEIGSAILVT
ncbi:hypothetical protein TNCV_280281 [Trichonephila clavipes]|nr:hypothetical protein TNCV_280281 [Trichonephila clavipes]